MTKVADILKETRAFVESKQASAFSEKQGLAGQDPNTYPGAEHDKPVDSSSMQPDPGANQDVNSPEGAYSAKGAKPANQKEQGSALEATDPPPVSVKKEPAVSSDAMAGPKGGGSVGDQPVAKHAELANDLLSAVKKAQDAKTASDDAPAEGEGEPAPAATPAEGEPAPAEGEGEGEAAPAEGEAAPAEGEGEKEASAKGKGDGEGEPEKKAEGNQSELELTQDVLAKIASALLSTEDGWELVENGLSKVAGAEAARETMTFLQQEEEDLQKQALYAQGQADAEALIKQAIWQAGYDAAQAQAAPQVDPEKQAEVATAQLKQAAGIESDEDAAAKGIDPEALKKLGRALADNSVKSAQGLDLAALAGGGGMPPEMGAEMPPEMGAEAPGGEEALDEMGGAPMDEEITPEELEQALAMLVQSGELSEEEVAAIMEHIQASGDLSAAGDAAEAGAAEEAAAEGMETEASAQNLLDAIRRVKAQKAE